MEENKQVVSNENFDWTAFETDANIYGEQSKEQVADQYNESLSKIQVGEVVEGTVIALNKREVVVNIGYKSDGVIPVTEFRYNPELSVGEVVEVYVDNQEDKRGQLVLSHKKARASKSWERVNAALESKEVIK